MPLVVTDFSEDLHETYKIVRKKPQKEEWPPYQPTSIVNVTVIHYQNKQKRQELIKISEHLRRGAAGISEIESSPPSHSTVTKDINEIFKVDPADQTEYDAKSEPPRFILIEGAPGIGKTVLAKEIAYLWANHQLLTDCKILILVYLRDPNVHTMKSLEELLQLYTTEKVANEVSSYLEKSKGQNAAFIFDGFDEFPTLKEHKNSIIADIIGTGNYVRKFYKSTVVITSRPTLHATLFLQSLADRRIEILGFDPEERNKLISQFPNKTAELEKYMKNHPIISSVCYIPLNLAILLYLFDQGSLPKTLTEMNESFVIHTVYRHMEKTRSPLPGVIEHLKDIPEDILSKIIQKLAKLAFDGLQNDQLVFTHNELNKMCPEILDTPEASDGYSLLQAVKHYPQKGTGTTTTYNFLHLTMQEYLAAYYVSTLSDKLQLDLLQKTFWEGRLNFMWMMYVGTVGVKSDAFVSFIGMKATHKISVPCNKKNTFNQGRQITNMRYLHLFQCYMEDKTNIEMPKEISAIFSNGSINFTDITLLSHHVTSLLIFMFTYSTQQWKGFALNKCNLQKLEMSNVLHSISNNIERTSTLEYVDLSENTSSPWGIYCTIIRYCCGNTLTLCGDEGMNEYIQEIINSLQANSTIKSLVLYSIGKVGVEAIRGVLSNNRTLKGLKLSWQIRELNYYNIERTLIHTFFSTKTDVNHSSQTVNVNASCDVDICYKFLPIRLRTQNDEPGSIHLPHEKVDDNAVHVLVFGLHSDTTIKHLNISNNEITDEGAVAIIDCLKHNKTLKKLNLSYNRISSHGMNKLVMNIKSQGMLSLEYVDLSKNGYSSSVGLSVHHHHDNPSLWGVYSAIIRQCNNNSLTLCGDEGMNEYIEEITDNLQANPNLQSLTLFCIGNIGVQAINEILRNNSTLKRLNLSMHKIDVIAAEMYVLTHIPNTECSMQNRNTEKYLRGVSDVTILFFLEINIKLLLIVFANDVCTYLYAPNTVILSDRYIGNNKIHLIAFGLCNNTTSLQELNVSDNMISDEGVAAIIDIMKHNKSLKKLDVSQNMIKTDGMDKMFKYFEEQGTTISLEYVNLSKNSASPWDVYCAIIRHDCVNSLTVYGDESIMFTSPEKIIKSLDKNMALQSLTICNVEEWFYMSFDHFLNYEPPKDLEEMPYFELIQRYKILRCYSLNVISGSNNKITIVVNINDNNSDHLPNNTSDQSTDDVLPVQDQHSS